MLRTPRKLILCIDTLNPVKHLETLIKVSKTNQWNNHTLLTNPRHREEETENTNNNTTPKKIKLKHPILIPQREDCKTRRDTKYCKTKQGPNSNPQKQKSANFSKRQMPTYCLTGNVVSNCHLVRRNSPCQQKQST